MLILAFESSSKPASVAVCKDGELLGLYYQNSGLTHSRTLLAMAESLLKNLELRAAEIDLIAVSRGPGSFTGVRIGVSAAKGLAWGLEIPVCGVSTLEAMARQAPEPGYILCPAMDARRGQIYNALFEWKNNALERLNEDRAITLEELATEAETWSKPIMAIGDGAAICHERLKKAGINSRIAPELQRWQTAYGVAAAAIAATAANPGAATAAAELEPTYLRPSQAERNLLSKNR